MKNETANDMNGVKIGCGNQSNSFRWVVAYNPEFEVYVAKMNMGSICGGWEEMYEITKEIYEQAGTFEDDDYKTERLIRTGRILYRFENSRSYPDKIVTVHDRRYKKLCKPVLDL